MTKEKEVPKVEGDGYLHVASFVEVVNYSKERYPKGVKKYEVKQSNKDDAPAEEE